MGDKSASDPLKIEAEIQKANLQGVDTASLPMDEDTLKLVFTLRVLGRQTNSKQRNACPSCNTRAMVETAAHLIGMSFPLSR